MQDEQRPGAAADWDVALAGMLADAHDRRGRPLTVDDLVDLAQEHATRLDDLLDTVRALCAAGRWCYEGAGGAVGAVELPATGRVSVADVAHLEGGWRPVAAPS